MTDDTRRRVLGLISERQRLLREELEELGRLEDHGENTHLLVEINLAQSSLLDEMFEEISQILQ